MNRRTFIAASSMAGLSACARPARSKRLEMSIVAVSEELDPYVAPNLETAELSWLYADGLVGSNLASPEAGSLSAAAPKPGTFGPGRFTSFDYQLRPGVRWHDGKPLVASDVAACVARAQSSVWGHQRPFSVIEKIELHDELRFTVHLKQSDPNFARAFFSPLGAPGVPLVRAGSVPIGTGAFRIADRQPDTVYYERWAGSPRGVPRVAEVRFQYLGDGATELIRLSSGDTDVALFVPPDYVLKNAIPYFRRDRGVFYAVLNVRGALDTPEVRSAFTAAIDVREIVETFYRGWSMPYHTVVGSSVPGAEISLAHPYDPEFARRVFARWPKRTIEIAVYPGRPEQIALMMREYLAKAGVELTLRRYADQVLLAPDGPLRSGRFDVALFGDSFSLDPDLTATWGCSTIPPNGGNFSRLCDLRLDALATSGDLPGALRVLREQAVVLPLVRSVQCVAVSSRLRGVVQPPALAPAVYECANWWIA